MNKKWAYYNEWDPYAAQWIRNLIKAGHVAPGEVDERSIEDVRPDDLRGFAQVHMFAGIAVWSYALRRAGWPDDRPVWTGSCPCQPFSAAGKGSGFDDERHLWPAFHWLIGELRPPVVFGEQVASKDAEPWLDLVSTDLEALDLAFGAIAFPSAGVGAPHIRDRIYWMAYAAGKRRNRRANPSGDARRYLAKASGATDLVADANDSRSQGRQRMRQRALECIARPRGVVGVMADSSEERLEQHAQCDGEPIARSEEGPRRDDASGRRGYGDAGPANGFWRDADWLLCRDDKWRPVEPGAFPLVDGTTARVGRLRAYGNAINAQQAAAFIEVAAASIEETS